MPALIAQEQTAKQAAQPKTTNKEKREKREMNQNKTAILIHTKHYRDTQGNTYSATICQFGHELALVIPKAYGAPDSQQYRILRKITENLGLKDPMTFSELETFLGGTIYRITEKATAREVKAWGRND